MYYYVGSTTSLANLRLKENSAPQPIAAGWQNAIRIPNDVAYSSCTDEHKYRMTVQFDASAAGGDVRLYQNGYNQGSDVTVASGTNTVSIDFVSKASLNTSANNTQIQLANVAQGTIIDNISYTFTEMPREVTDIYGTSVGGNSLTVTWAPAAAGLPQDYQVTLLDSSGTTTVAGPYTVTAAQASAGYTFTGLTGGTTYTAKVEGVYNGFTTDAVTDTFTVDPWVPVAAGDAGAVSVGSDGTDIFNQYAGNLEYYSGTTTTLINTLRVKTTSTPHEITAAWQNAIRIPNNALYSLNTTSGHKYRMTVNYTATGDNVGGTLRVHQQGYGKNGDDTVTSGPNYATIDFVSDSGVNTSAYNTQIQLASINAGTEIKITSITFDEIPREVLGAGVGSSIGLTNAGGKYVSTSWTPSVTMTGEEYEVSLLDSSDNILNTVTVPISTTEYKFQDGTTDDNGRTITISPNTVYKTQIVSKVGTEKSDPVFSDGTTNTGVWMRMGSVGQSPAEDVLNVANNARVSSFWGNLYYRYDHTSSLSDLVLKKTSNPEDDNPEIYYFHRVGQKNSAIFGNTENGAKVRLTVSYNTSASAGGTIILQQKHGSDYTNTKHTVVPNMTGANKDSFYVDFDYYTADANEYTDLVLGELTANSEISGIEFSVTVLEHWTAGTADGGWHDVGDYGYHLPADQAGYYSTDTSANFALKVNWLNWTEWTGQWGQFFVGTNEKTVYPGSVYSYDISFHRTVPVTNPTDNQNRVYLHILYDNGTDAELAYDTCDANGKVSFEGEVTIPDDATTARLYWICQWPSGNERLSVDSDGTHYTFDEVWRAVDQTQEVRDGKYEFIDKDGGAMQYKPSQTSGTGSCDVRVQDGFTDPWVPYLKTNFAEGDYGVNFVEGNEYVATITFDSNVAITTDGNKGIRFSDYNSGEPNSIALTGNEFEITFIYKDGYDITAGLGWLGESNVVLSNFNVSVRNGAPTMPLTNNGTDVVADWSGMSGVSGATKLVYVSFGEQKIIDVTGQSSYTFPSPFYPDNDTEVELYDRYTSSSDHGTKLTRATALADFQIIDARVDGIAHANTNNIIKMTIKNVGTGKVIASDENQKFIYLTARQGTWKNYKYLCPDPLQPIPRDAVVLDPNEVFDDQTTPANKTPNIDAWRVEQEGVYTIKCQINETKIIREKDYTNNSFTFTKEVSTQLADDTAVLGFQLNSNKNPGGPSEFNPSYRTVCRANKQVVVKEGDYAYDEEGNRLDVPVGTYTAQANNFEYGFVFALHDKAGLTSKNEDELMTFAGAQDNEYIKTLKANNQVDITEWTTKEGSTYNKDNSFFFALTLKDLFYTTDQYETVYTFRSYLKFTVGGTDYIVYPKDVYSTSLYDIAEDLYKNKKMPSSEGHDYLYDNVLNIVSMKHNAKSIGQTMMRKLNAHGQMPSSSSPNYRYANNVYQDMTFYALCSDPEGKTGGQYDAMVYLYADNIKRVKKNGEGDTYEISGEPASDEQVIQSAYTYNGYTYTHDREFRSIRLDKAGGYNSFLTALNASKENSSTNYESVNDWIYGEVPHDTGYYKKVEYSWDSNLDKDYGTE